MLLVRGLYAVCREVLSLAPVQTEPEDLSLILRKI